MVLVKGKGSPKFMKYLCIFLEITTDILKLIGT